MEPNNPKIENEEEEKADRDAGITAGQDGGKVEKDSGGGRIRE